MKKESVLLAQTYKQGKYSIAGSYLSEKLDGMRCLWIPFTRGMRKADVPFANTAKDERLVNEEICTGLWSKYMNVIHSPDWWLDDMPNVIIDGELYSSTLPRQDLMSIIKKKNKNMESERWSDVEFYAFSIPFYRSLFSDGRIYNANIDITYRGVDKWMEPFLKELDYHPKSPLMMRQEVELLNMKVSSPSTVIVEQEKLPFGEDLALDRVFSRLDEVTDAGGEGLMVRKAFHIYSSCRSHDLIKFKKLQDAEGEVVGYTTGKLTEKDSRNLGRLGALTIKLANGRTFELSGFTDDEREFITPDLRQWACDNPDSRVPDHMEHPIFRRGTVISYRYRGVTQDGIPTEARYWRDKVDE